MRSFVHALVSDRLIAAGHVDTMTTAYRWRGEVHQKTEARAYLHTMRSRVESIAERVHAQHPYEVACVAATQIVAGDPAYLEWVAQESTPKSQQRD